MKTPEEKRAARTAAQRKWAQSEKGKAYYQRKKEQAALVPKLCEGCLDEKCKTNGCLAA